MVKAAKEAGADWAKFQLYSDGYVDKNEKLRHVLEKGRLSVHELEQLQEQCQEMGIGFLVSAFDLESLTSIYEMGCDAVKIPSVCNEDSVMISYARQQFDSTIVSFGLMDTMVSEVYGMPPKVYKLQCTSAYPCPYDQVNLLAMNFMDGFSDHTLGDEVAIAAAAMGAKIIEKHMTIDGGGPDKKVALNTDEFGIMVRRIRNVEQAMGDGRLKIEDSERELLWRK